MPRSRKHTTVVEGQRVPRSVDSYIATLEENLRQPNLPQKQRNAISANLTFARRRGIPTRNRGNEPRRWYEINWFGWRK